MKATDLVVDERDLLRDTLNNEFMLEFEVLKREDRVVVLVDVRGAAFFLCARDGGQRVCEWRNTFLELSNQLFLFLHQGQVNTPGVL